MTKKPKWCSHARTHNQVLDWEQCYTINEEHFEYGCQLWTEQCFYNAEEFLLVHDQIEFSLTTLLCKFIDLYVFLSVADNEK